MTSNLSRWRSREFKPFSVHNGGFIYEPKKVQNIGRLQTEQANSPCHCENTEDSEALEGGREERPGDCLLEECSVKDSVCLGLLLLPWRELRLFILLGIHGSSICYCSLLLQLSVKLLGGRVPEPGGQCVGGQLGERVAEDKLSRFGEEGE